MSRRRKLMEYFHCSR